MVVYTAAAEQIMCRRVVGFAITAFAMRRSPSPYTRAGVTTDKWLAWWAEAEPEVTADTESYAIPGTTESSIAEVVAMAPPWLRLGQVIVVHAVQFRAYVGVAGDGTSDAVISKVEWEFGIVDDENAFLEPVVTHTETVDIRNASTSAVWRYVVTRPIEIQPAIISYDQIYLKLRIYGYYTGTSGTAYLDFHQGRWHQMVRVFGGNVALCENAEH